MPNGKLPTDPVPELVPDFVVEVLGAGNTRGEMARKRREYFLAGVRLVWRLILKLARWLFIPMPSPSALRPRRRRLMGLTYCLAGRLISPGFSQHWIKGAGYRDIEVQGASGFLI